MKKKFISDALSIWKKSAMLVAMAGVSTLSFAQEGSQGNTTIFGGVQMTFFGNHNFLTGGGGAQPGVILTDRSTANFGILNFLGDNLVSKGASDAGYVDGYVRKYGAGRFVFPVGDNNHLGRFAASASGTMGAYFFANPNTAVTSNLFTGTNYPALPSGAPFSTLSAKRGPGVKVVSAVEYWDIDGATATPITLTWNAGSNVNTMTGGTLSFLTIVGWNGSKWVRIPSAVDATSLLGVASTVSEGSITTASSIVPDTYTAYSLAAVGPDLSPRITATPNVVHGTTILEVIVAAVEVGTLAPTTGAPVTLYVRKNALLSAFSWNPLASLSADGSPVQNSIWTQTEDANYYIFTTNAVIPKSSQRRLLFHITLTPGVSDGTVSLTTNIRSDGSGGESNYLNNGDTDEILYYAN